MSVLRAQEAARMVEGLDLLDHPVWVVDLASAELLAENTAARLLPVAEEDGADPAAIAAELCAAFPANLAEGAAAESEVEAGSVWSLRLRCRARRVSREGRPLLVVEGWPVSTERAAKPAAPVLSLRPERTAGAGTGIAPGIPGYGAEVLGLIASGAPLDTVLTEILHMVETGDPKLVCSLILLDESGTQIARFIGPKLPADYRDGLVGRVLDPEVGACGRSMSSGRRVATPDIATDPSWERSRRVMLDLGLHTCIAEPIRMADQRIAGCFCLYGRRPGLFTADQVRRIETAGFLAAMAIEGDRRQRAVELASERLRHNERVFRSLIDAAPMMIFLKDAAGRYRRVNRHFLEVHGFESEEAVRGQTAREVFGEPAGNVLMSNEPEISDDRPIISRVIEHPAMPGRFFSTTKFRVPDDDGGPPGIGGIGVEVTEREVAERLRREAEARFRLLFEMCPVGISLDRLSDGRGVANNPAILALTGWSEAQLGQINYMDNIPPEYREQERQALEELRTTGRHVPLERELLRRDGSRFPALITGVLLRDFDGEEVIMTTVQDLTAQKDAERRLRLLTERLRLAIQVAGVGVIEYDIREKVLTCNTRQAEIYGVADRAGHMTRPEDWIALVHPEDRPAALARFEAQLAGRRGGTAGFRILRPDGVERHLRVTTEVLREGEVPSRIVAVTVDVTSDVLMAEALALRTREAEAANTAKSRFLANMSHEIRTPMNAILGSAQLLGRMALGEAERAYVDAIDRSGRELLELIDDLLDIGRIEAGAAEVAYSRLDCAALVGDALRAVRDGAEAKGLRLAGGIAPDLPSALEGDARRIRQVLVNLLSNAVKYTQEGSVDVRVEPRPTGMVRFSVSDTGPGVDPELRDAIFGRFAQGPVPPGTIRSGAGLGLAISKEFVELMGGRIGLEEGPDGGACFWFEVPLGCPAD